YEKNATAGMQTNVIQKGLLSQDYETFFFFQAEDGIRDYKVTGVQTCALPIYCGLRFAPRSPQSARDWSPVRAERILHRPRRGTRSEERRVGKECRSRTWA